jgi:hypothetical protein
VKDIFNLRYLKKTMTDQKGVFDGNRWTPVVVTEGKEKPVPPVEDGDGTVFVSVASYRGERMSCRTAFFAVNISETLHGNTATVITHCC